MDGADDRVDARLVIENTLLEMESPDDFRDNVLFCTSRCLTCLKLSTVAGT